MSTVGKRLNLVLSIIIKQKRIHGMFNLEGILEVISRLESIDIEYEKKSNICLGLVIFFVIGSVILFLMGQGALGFIAIIMEILLLVILFHLRRFDLDDEFRLFFRSALMLLKDRFNPNTDIEVNLELKPSEDRRFYKSTGPIYEEEEFIGCYDNFYERNVGYITIPLKDGNRLTVAEKEKLIVSHKESRYQDHRVIERRKHFIQTIRLQINHQKYRCTSLPPEASKPKLSSAMTTTLYDETIKHSRSEDIDILEISYIVKFDNPRLHKKEMTVDPNILPDQIYKLYSYLNIVPEHSKK